MKTKIKMKKKIYLAFVWAALGAVFFFSACAMNPALMGEKSLQEHGMDVVSLMEDMVKSNSYRELMMPSTQELQALSDRLAAGSYSRPEAVYEVSLPSIRKFGSIFGEGETGLEGLPESLLHLLEGRRAETLISSLNSQMGGTASLAVSSLYRAEKIFDSSQLRKDTLYVYTFKNGTPIAVSFTKGENNAVSANGTFIMCSALLEGEISAESLQSLFEGIAGECAVKKL